MTVPFAPILGPTIEQLRSFCAPFAGRVAGAADFRKGLVEYTATMPLPAAYVIPSKEEVEARNSNQDGTGYWQIIDKTISVVVELDASTDRRGQAAAMDYDEIEAALFASLINWAPIECRVPGGQGFAFDGSQELDLDRARLFYEWRFNLRYQLTEEDGWQFPSEDLTGIELDVYKAPPFKMPPPDGRPPAAIIKIPTDQDPYSQWDDNETLWELGDSVWDAPPFYIGGPL